MAPRAFLKRGEGTSRFENGGLAQARAIALARAYQKNRQGTHRAEQAELLQVRHSAHISAGRVKAPEALPDDRCALRAQHPDSNSRALHLALQPLQCLAQARAAAGRHIHTLEGDRELSEFEELEATVRRRAPSLALHTIPLTTLFLNLSFVVPREGSARWEAAGLICSYNGIGARRPVDCNGAAWGPTIRECPRGNIGGMSDATRVAMCDGDGFAGSELDRPVGTQPLAATATNLFERAPPAADDVYSMEASSPRSPSTVIKVRLEMDWL